MEETRPRRRRAARVVLAALTAAGAFVVAALPADAVAAAKPVTLTWEAPEGVAVPPGGSDQVMPLFFDSNVTRTYNTPVTLTYDLRGLAGVATLTFQGDCSTAGEIVTCHDTLVTMGSPSGREVVAQHSWGELTAVGDAALGAAGSYTMTAQAPGLRIIGGSRRVAVGGPELKAAPVAAHTGLKVGTTVPVQVGFTNNGDRASHGSAIGVLLGPGLSFGRTYRNCSYAAGTGQSTGSTEAVCTFAGDVRLGESEQLASALAVSVGKQALDPSVMVFAGPTAATVQALNGTPLWHQGTGAALGLRVIVPGRSSTVPGGTLPLQTSPAMQDTARAYWTVHNTADLGVWGAEAKGRRGAVVPVTVGLRNNGPGSWAAAPGYGSPYLQFTLPAGVTAVTVPYGCFPYGTAVTPSFVCTFEGAFGPAILDGASASFTFGLRVDQVVHHATGSVVLENAGSYDTNLKNDRAPVTVN